ncbi:phosphoglycolate phosphatase [Breznakia sp. PF5-3]|uniref:HAD family hydrolase n=1 Tax=unclassified Breznakia TaxID=2623764 RepID=UPI0024053DB4|nr:MULTISPECIES: HAD family hydrolase [unclassified Breznakia]MDF9824360.1 phosphoglycolate phosphatase [Breznakia sp. PM6-1]MDF9835049.1 phosphoglycolate phosphatase [Breznakia sp. PF5-3]MDF9837780.1 phosphoglycolate phosphatase [Breznakia sp. PFB2-8]MDF9859659.1 phosphoglycolate phosphatase [Breznakia sp. PH5-24]
MNNYKGVIFDLDGTLLDTLSDLSNSVNKVLETYNYPIHDKATYKKKIGRGFKDLICRSMPEDTEASKVEAGLQMFLKIYDQDFMKETKPYEGIDKVLSTLQENHIKVAVNSNKRTDYTNALIQKHFPNICFVECFGERQGIPKKPDPTSALELRNLMEFKSDEILYIGDSKTDIQTANNASMDSVGVLWGFREEDELVANGATYIARTPEDILKIILKG